MPYAPPEKAIWRRLRKLARWANSNWQYQYGIDEWWDPAADATVRALHREFQFDVVVVEYVFFSKALELFDAKTTRLLDTHDVFTNRYRLFLENNSQPQWFSTTERQESKALNRADAVLAIQDDEASWFAQHTQRPVLTVGHPVQLAQPLQNLAPQTKPFQLLYVGSASSINVESLNWFIRDVMPLLRRAKTPPFKLVVAGKVGERAIDCPEIERLGQVDDLADCYHQASIVINPTRFGTGLKIKTVEALGYARPLVTTAIGADGLDHNRGNRFVVANDAADFSAALVTLLNSNESRLALSAAARDYAENRNNAVTAELQTFLQEQPDRA